MTIINDIVFPTGISSGSSGGPRWGGEVIITDSGWEQRNQRWTYPLHDYDAAYGIKTVADLEEVLTIFHVARATTYGFRYRDPLDFKSCARDSGVSANDQVLIDSAVGGETTAQLVKSYTYGSMTMTRKITRPIAASVLVAKNGTPLAVDTDYTLDDTTGVITLTSALVATDSLSWGGQFHVPVRFDSNNLSIQLDEYTHGGTTVPLVEVRE